MQGSLRPLLGLVSRTGIPPESLIRRCRSTWPGAEALGVCWMWVQGCGVPRGAGQAFLLILGRTHPRPPPSLLSPRRVSWATCIPCLSNPPAASDSTLRPSHRAVPLPAGLSSYSPLVHPLDVSIHIPMPISLPASDPDAPLDLPPPLSKHHQTLSACQHCSSSRVSGGHNGTNSCACDPCVVSAVREGRGGSGWSGGPL